MTHSVLIVENDPFTRTILQRRLKNAGYEAKVAENGVQALALVEQDSPDLILSDWMMPEMDGQELCRRVKARSDLRPTYFILLTARDQESDIVSALEAGADEYLIKPVEAKELLARVNAGIRIVELQRDLRSANGRLNDALTQIEKELQIVANIQRSLLPQELPKIQGVQFSAFYRPSSQSGGDYYDVLPLPDDRLGLVMADVSGHGTPAMVAMALTRLLVHSHASACRLPSEFLATINAMLFEYLPTEQYVTMFYAILDLKTRELTYSSAGQPAPLWWQNRPDGMGYLSDCEGFPLKLVDPDVQYDDHAISLQAGHRLLLYTDGVTDAVNPQNDMYGSERLAESMSRQVQQSIGIAMERIVGEMDDFADGAPQMDDITFLQMAIAQGD